MSKGNPTPNPKQVLMWFAESGNRLGEIKIIIIIGSNLTHFTGDALHMYCFKHGLGSRINHYSGLHYMLLITTNLYENLQIILKIPKTTLIVR